MDGEVLNHMQTSISRRDISHKVTFSPKSRLRRIIGEFAYTISFHHQVIDSLGSGLIASGHTSDGIIEAVEMPSRSFVIGVQWHPENMYKTSVEMKRLFQIFMMGTGAN